MSISRDKARGQFLFEFDRIVEGRRIRVRKRLPKAWTRAQADAYDGKKTAELYASIAHGERAPFTIDQAVAAYLKDKAHLKSFTPTSEHLMASAWAYVGRPIEELPEVAAEIAGKYTGILKPQTIKNRIAVLRAACRWGWKKHGMCDRDPAERLQMPHVDNERQVYRSRAEVLQIARACTRKDCRAIILCGFYTGMRLGEILRAQVAGDVFILGKTKNGNPRHVPIHPKLRQYVWHWPLSASRRTVQYWFEYAREQAGFPETHFHDLRHSTASALILAGVDLYVVGGVLGHASSHSTRRYAHLQTSTLAAAVSKLAVSSGKKSPPYPTKKAS